MYLWQLAGRMILFKIETMEKLLNGYHYCCTVSLLTVKHSLLWHLKSVSHSSFSWILGFQKWLGRRKNERLVWESQIQPFLESVMDLLSKTHLQCCRYKEVKICGPLKIMVLRLLVKTGNRNSLGTWLMSLSSTSSPVAQAWNIDIKYIFKIFSNLEQKEEVLKHKGWYQLWWSLGSTIKSGLRAEDGQSTALCHLFLLSHPVPAIPVNRKMQNTRMLWFCWLVGWFVS